MILFGNHILEPKNVLVDFAYHNISSAWEELENKVNKKFFAVHTLHKAIARISQF